MSRVPTATVGWIPGWIVPLALAIYLGVNYLAYLEERLSGGVRHLHSFPYRSALNWARCG